MNKKYIKIILSILSIILIVITALAIRERIIDPYMARIINAAGISIVIALSLNLISGFTGQLSLGHAGFMAVGAYTTAYSLMQFKMPILPALLLAGIVTAIFGFVIGFPTLRLRGDYLAIVTLGFGEIIRVIMINLEKITGGAAGLKGIPTFSENLKFAPFISFLWIYAFVFLTAMLISNLIQSSPGRAIVSVREDEIAANAMGINIFYHKMFSFTLSAFIAGIGGGLFALYYHYLNPTMFTFLKSCDFLIIVVLGGMGSITFTVAAGFILTWLQEALRVFQDFRLVVYPLLLIIMMLFSPLGLAGISKMVMTLLKTKLKKKGGEQA